MDRVDSGEISYTSNKGLCERHYICQTGDLLFSFKPGPRYVAMLYAYFDESGHPADSQVVSIAAVVAPIFKWHIFEDEWRRILDYYGIPENKGLHMTDYENRRGEFSGWDRNDPRSIPFISAMADVLTEHIQFGCVFSIIMNEWETLIQDRFPDLFERKRSSFIVLLQTCLEAIHQALPEDQPVACMFEETKFLAGAAPAHFAQWKTLWGLEERFDGSLSFGKKYKYPALQGADMLAYEGAKHVLNQAVKRGQFPERKLHAQLRRSEKITAGYYDHQGLMDWLQHESRIQSLLWVDNEI